MGGTVAKITYSSSDAEHVSIGNYVKIGEEVATIDSLNNNILKCTLYGHPVTIDLSKAKQLTKPPVIRIRPDGTSELL